MPKTRALLALVQHLVIMSLRGTTSFHQKRVGLTTGLKTFVLRKEWFMSEMLLLIDIFR